MRMRDCPKCGAAVDGPWFKTCGEGRTASAKQAPTDPTHGLCHYEDRGQRCGNLGTFSPSTNGSGPWFCRQHIPGSRDASGQRTPDGARKLAAIAASLRPKAIDAEAELERLAIQGEGR